MILILSFCILLSLILASGGYWWFYMRDVNYYIDNDDKKQSIELKDQELKAVKKLVLNAKDLEEGKKIKLLYSNMEFVEKNEIYEKEFDNPTDISIVIVQKDESESCPTNYKYDSSTKQCEIEPSTCPEHYKYDTTTKQCEVDDSSCPEYNKYDTNTKQCELNLTTIGTLVGYYTADSWDQTNLLWKDMSSNSKDATISGTGTKQDNLITGTKTTKVVFPSGLLPSTFTLFYVAKYNGTAKGRILNGYPENWLIGFHGGKSGVAFFTKWMTAQKDNHIDNLVLSSSTNNLYRSNGIQRSTTTGGKNTTTLSINGGLNMPKEASDWAIGEIIIYDGELDEDKIKVVENYLAKKYSITLETTIEGFSNIGYNKNYSLL